jgi:hypothetical protein
MIKNSFIPYLLIATISLFFSKTNYAKRVFKVSGSKVYFKTKGISVKKGRSYSVKSAGFEVGSIKVLKVKGGSAIGKIVDGYISVGDRVSGKKKKKRRRSGRKGKRSRKSKGKMKYYGVLGHIGLNFLSEQSDSNEAPSAQFDTQTGLNFRFTGPFSKTFHYGVNFLYTSGTLTLPTYSPTDTTKSGYLESQLNSTFWELSGIGLFNLNRMFYLYGGMGWTSVSGEGTIALDATTSSSYSATYQGYSFIGGLGLNIKLTKSLFGQADFNFRYINFTSANIESPQQSGTFAVEDVTQTGYTLLLGLGMKF